MRANRLLNNPSLLIISIALALIAAELMLALLGLPRFYQYHSAPPQFGFIGAQDGQVIYVNAPSADIRFIYDGNPRGYFDKDNAVSHKTNSRGFRGPEFSADKPADTIRIAFIGDSFTFGEGVRFEDTYAEKLTKLLNQKGDVSPASREKRPLLFESYNFGVGGYNSVNELFALENFALPYGPDVVVLKYDLSEAEPALFALDPADGRAYRVPRWYETGPELFNTSPPVNILYRSRLAQIIWRMQNSRKRNARMLAYYHSLYAPDSPQWQASEQALRQMVRACRRRGIPVYVIFFPMLYRLDQYPFEYVHARVGGIVHEEEGTFIDLYPHLSKYPAHTLWVHPTDHHPNELVHNIAAAAVEKSLKQNNRRRCW